MEYIVFRKALKEHIEGIIKQYKEVSPAFDIKLHCKNHSMKYETFRKMMAGPEKSGQEWYLEYFLKVAESFSVPPEKFLKDVLKKYNEISRG